MSRKLLTLLRRRGGGAAIVTDGLVAEYRFDEGSGQVLTDCVGSSNLTLGTTGGVDANDPAWVAAGLKFTTDDRCFNASAPAVSSGGATHVFCSTMQATPGSTQYIFDSSGGGRQYAYWSDPGGIGKIAYSAGSAVTSAAGVLTAGWKVYTVIFNGASSGVYIGNSLVSSGDAGSGALVGLYICGRAAGGVYMSDATFGYYMVYNKALSTDEISQNLAAITLVMSGRGVVLP